MPKALIGGFAYSHASYRATLLGKRIPVKEFGVKHSVERGAQRANSRKPIAYTIGEWNGEVSLTVSRATWDELKAHAQASRGKPILDCSGDLVLVYGERGLPSGSIQVSFAGISEADGSSAQGTDASEVKLSLNVLDILENGASTISAEEDF